MADSELSDVERNAERGLTPDDIELDVNPDTDLRTPLRPDETDWLDAGLG